MDTPKRLCDETGCARPVKVVSLGLCLPCYRRFRSPYAPVSTAAHARMADVLEWIMDGEPLTSAAERALYEPLDLAA